jgi:hypothetical protein
MWDLDLGDKILAQSLANVKMGSVHRMNIRMCIAFSDGCNPKYIRIVSCNIDESFGGSVMDFVTFAR